MKKKTVQRITAFLLTLLLAVSSGLSSFVQASETSFPVSEESKSGEEKADSGEGLMPDLGIPADETIIYYEVKVDYPSSITEEEKEEITLPDPMMVEKGTEVSILNTPMWDNHMFVGWYNDPELTDPVPIDECITKNRTLYPEFVSRLMDMEERKNFVARMDVPVKYPIFLHAVGLSAEEVTARLSLMSVSSGENIEFTVESRGQKLDLETLGLNDAARTAVENLLAHYQEDPKFGLMEPLYDLIEDSKEVQRAEENEEAQNKEEESKSDESTLKEEDAENEENEDENTVILTEEAAEIILWVYAHDEWAEMQNTSEAWKILEILLQEQMPEELQIEMERKTILTEEMFRKALGLSEEESIEAYLILEKDLDVDLVLDAEKELGLIPSVYAEAVWEEYELIPKGEVYSGGELYSVQILDTHGLHFIFEGEETNDYVTKYNFRTHQDDYVNVSLNSSVIFIPLKETEGVDIDIPLVSVAIGEDGEKEAIPTQRNGVLTYRGPQPITIGQNIAIYEGTLQSNGAVDGKVTYIEILSVDGNGQYHYQMAEMENLLFIPDVLPIPDDGSFEDGEIIVEAATLDFTSPDFAPFNLNADTVVEVGDFAAFYQSESNDLEQAQLVGYGQITKVERLDNGSFHLIYEICDQQRMEEAAGAFLSYDHPELEYTEEELAILQAEMEEELANSKLAEEVDSYVTALATDESLDLDQLEYGDVIREMTFTLDNGEEITLEEVRKLAGGGRIQLKESQSNVLIGLDLKHFIGSAGVRVEISGSFKWEIFLDEAGGKRNTIEITAAFGLETEVSLLFKFKTKLVWKEYRFLKFPVDMQIQVGSIFGFYLGTGLSASVKTKAEQLNKNTRLDEILKLDGIFDGKKGEEILKEKGEWNLEIMTMFGNGLEKMSDAYKNFFKSWDLRKGHDDKVDPHALTVGSLAQSYMSFVKGGTYVDLIDKKLWTPVDFRPDPMQMVNITISIHFVFSIKASAMLGLGLYSSFSKENVYTFLIREGTSKHEEADGEDLGIHANAYVFGAFGIKAGFRLDLRLGLVSARLASIGLLVDMGIYAEFYGFAYANWDKTGKIDNYLNFMGTAYGEAGIYVELYSLAQLGDGKLSNKQLLLSYHNPVFFKFGDKKFAIDFHIGPSDDKLNLEIKEGNKIKVPSEIFVISEMDLVSGKTDDLDKDSSTYGSVADSWRVGDREYTQFNEQNFIVKTSSRDIRYLPESNLIIIDPLDPTVTELEGSITFIYNVPTFGFTVNALSRTVHVKWKAKETELTIEHVRKEDDGTCTVMKTETVKAHEDRSYLYSIARIEDLYLNGSYRLSGIKYPEDEGRMIQPGFTDQLKQIMRDGQGTLYLPVRQEHNVVRLYYTVPVQSVQWRIGEMESRIGADGDLTYSLKRTLQRSSFELKGTEPMHLPKYKPVAGMDISWYVVEDSWNQLTQESKDLSYLQEYKEGMMFPENTIRLFGMAVPHVAKPHTVSWMDGEKILTSEQYMPGDKLRLPGLPEKTGYTFAYWEVDGHRLNDDYTMPERDVVIHAVWTVNQYNVIWKDGDRTVQSAVLNYGSVLHHPALKKACYTLSWLSGGDIVPEGMSVPDRDLVIEANWTFAGHRFGVSSVERDPGCETEGVMVRLCIVCGENVREPIPALGHQYGEGKIVKEATCSEVGILRYTCSRCGAARDEEIPIESDHHTWDEGTIIEPMNCRKDGTRRYTCTGCGMERDEKIPADGKHTFTDTVVMYEPTCIFEGTKATLCSRCNYAVTEPIPALGHDWDDGEVGIEPGCTTEGKKYHHCSRCDEILAETLPALGHSYDEGQITVEPGCTTEGEYTYTCHRCGDTTVKTLPALGHSYDEGQIIVEPGCTSEGEFAYICNRCGDAITEKLPALGHSWDEGVITEPMNCLKDGNRHYSCQRCDAERDEKIPADGKHNFTDTVVMYEPTCIFEGTKATLCSRCSYVLTEPIPALGHDWDEGEVAIEPGCTTEGKKYHHCRRCDEILAETLPALDHTWDEGTIIEPMNCLKDGILRYTCAKCGMERDEKIPADGKHIFTDTVVMYEPTCIFKGTKATLCSRCSYAHTEPIPALGHDWDEGEVAIEQGCTTEGKKYHHCRRCDEILAETLPALGGHEYVLVVNTEPDCTNPGEKSYACTRCEEKLTEIYPALGHAYEDQIVEPTCLEEGYTIHTCSRCSDSYTDEIQAALGHQFGEPVETKAPGPDGPGILTHTCQRCGETQEEEEYLAYDFMIREDGVSINMLIIDQEARGWDPYLKNIPDTVKGQTDGNIDYTKGMNCYELIDPDYQGKLFGAFRQDSAGNLMLDQPVKGTYVWKDGEKALSEMTTGDYEVHFIPEDPCYQEADFVVPFELSRWVELKFYNFDEPNDGHYGYVGSSRHYEGQLVDLKRWEDIMLSRLLYLSQYAQGYEERKQFAILYGHLALRVDENGNNLNHCYADDEVSLVWQDGYLVVPEETVWIRYGIQ